MSEVPYHDLDPFLPDKKAAHHPLPLVSVLLEEEMTANDGPARIGIVLTLFPKLVPVGHAARDSIPAMTTTAKAVIEMLSVRGKPGMNTRRI